MDETGNSAVTAGKTTSDPESRRGNGRVTKKSSSRTCTVLSVPSKYAESDLLVNCFGLYSILTTPSCFPFARWCAMAKLFKNRSDNDIKNKWYSMSRKQKRISEQLLNEFAPVAASRADVSVAKTPNEFAPMAASRADVYVAKTFNKFAPMAASRDEVSVAKTLNGFASMAASRDDVSVAKTPSSSSDSEPSPLQTWSGTPMPPIPVKSGSTPDIGTGQNFASV